MMRVMGILLLISSAAHAAVVNFGDPAIEAAVRTAISKPAGDIDDTELTGITSLTVNGAGVVNLGGLGACVNLGYLDLSQNAIADLSPLVPLVNLTSLTHGATLYRPFRKEA